MRHPTEVQVEDQTGLLQERQDKGVRGRIEIKEIKTSNLAFLFSSHFI